MGGILRAIEHSAISTIDEGGMKWRVRKICSADLARVGHSALAVAQGLEERQEAAESNDSDIASQLKRMPVEQLETMTKLKDAVVAAGLLAVGDPKTDEWEDVKVVLDPDKADAKNGRLWVGAIPSTIADSLFTEIMSLSTDGGAALERLQSFRERSRNSADTGPGSEAIREASQ